MNRCESEGVVDSSDSAMSNDGSGSYGESVGGGDSSQQCLHRRRTLYLIRHGEAEHNVLEAQAQKLAQAEARQLDLSPEETWRRMEEARKCVLNDVSLRDARLTDLGRRQAKEVSKKLKELVAGHKIHHPTEAMCSPLSRCLETCKILMEDSDFKAHIRPEISERRTLLPPDKPKPLDQLLRCSIVNPTEFIVDLDQSTTTTPSSSTSTPNDDNDHDNDQVPISESKEMLRERANDMFDLLMECEHRHILVVSHKGFLRELERGLLGMPESPLFGNCEMRVYRVLFTKGTRDLFRQERIA